VLWLFCAFFASTPTLVDLDLEGSDLLCLECNIVNVTIDVRNFFL
jgi:hypothetical protein